jgi:DNA modification methylase
MFVSGKVIVGDNRETLKSLADGSVQCVVTSPPYWGLRDYGNDDQIGLEPVPDDYVEELCKVFDEVWRVLADDGTLWLNLGDTYSAQRWSGGGKGQSMNSWQDSHRDINPVKESGLPDKNLVGIPWKVAFALQARGWYLRQDIIWAKPNPMPESVTDRCTKSHEYIFLMSKSANYFFDHEAIREPAVNLDGESAFRNKRDVWTVTTTRYADAHFATYNPELIRPCIFAGTSEKGNCASCGKGWIRITERPQPPEVPDSEIDRYGNGSAGVHRKVGQAYQNWLNENPKVTIGWQKQCKCETDDVVPALVLDPFSGSGTTGEVAMQSGRNYVGLELNPDYAQLSLKRISDAIGMFGDVEVIQ